MMPRRHQWGTALFRLGLVIVITGLAMDHGYQLGVGVQYLLVAGALEPVIPPIIESSQLLLDRFREDFGGVDDGE